MNFASAMLDIFFPPFFREVINRNKALSILQGEALFNHFIDARVIINNVDVLGRFTIYTKDIVVFPLGFFFSNVNHNDYQVGERFNDCKLKRLNL